MAKRAAGRIGTVLAIIASLTLAACGEEPAAGSAPAPAAASANAVPVISGTPATAAAAGQPYVFQATATDDGNGTLTFSAQGLPDWLSLDAATGRLTGTPAADDAGQTADIVVAVNDGTQSAELPPFRIAITAAPPAGTSVAGAQPPTLSGVPTTSVTAGTAWSFAPTASDPDTLTLTFSIVNKPAWASFSAATGRLSGTPTSKQVGTTTGIVISANDGQAQVALPAFSVEVKAAVNVTIAGTPATTARTGIAYGFVPTTTAAAGATLGFSITNKPAWASFNTATGALTGTPGATQAGTYSGIVIKVGDGTTQASLPTFAIVVTATSSGAPTIAGQPAATARTGVAYSFRPTASDPNGDALTFTISGKPAWMTFNAATGELAGTPTSANVGTFSNIVIGVTDGANTVTLPAFNLLVSASTTGSATLSWTPPTSNTDGTTLTNLAGYRIYYGTNADSLTTSVQITNAGLTSYTIGGLSPGTYYFAIAAYTSDGVDGQASAVGSKTIT